MVVVNYYDGHGNDDCGSDGAHDNDNGGGGDDCCDNEGGHDDDGVGHDGVVIIMVDRKSTRLNSSHANISYAVFCLKKKTTKFSV